jgi:hypothetical protein
METTTKDIKIHSYISQQQSSHYSHMKEFKSMKLWQHVTAEIYLYCWMRPSLTTWNIAQRSIHFVYLALFVLYLFQPALNITMLLYICFKSDFFPDFRENYKVTTPTTNFFFATSAKWHWGVRMGEGGKAIFVTGRESLYDWETSRLPHFLANGLTDSSEVVSLTCRPPFTPGRFLVLTSVKAWIDMRAFLSLPRCSCSLGPIFHCRLSVAPDISSRTSVLSGLLIQTLSLPGP